ncbi:MAG: zinc ribbon domain-containing protein [Solirubrobacterales bacterium]
MPQVSRVEPASLMRVFGGLHRRAQQSLLDMLLPGEQPLVVVPGAAGSGIIGTEGRALVVKAGTRFGAPFHARSKVFEYESVIGVRLDTESSPAVVAVDAPLKIATCRIYWADARDDPWKARNAIPVEPSSFGIVLDRVLALRALVTAYREHHPALSTPQRSAPRPSSPNLQPLRAGDAPGSAAEGGVVAPLPVLTDRCPHCRAELRPGWKFCPACGTPSESGSSEA